MPAPLGGKIRRKVTIGAVSYLNSKPLVHDLCSILPGAKLIMDLPSRLADKLKDGRLDVALVPSIEYFRHPGCTVVSDSCVACDGPVKSVKLLCRLPIQRIRTLALDEGSRSSAALAQIMLAERFGITPALQSLPVGMSIQDCSADAVMLIGDRAMQLTERSYATVLDMGQSWSSWTNLPFVFAMWVARPGIDLTGLDQAFSSARDRGIQELPLIARSEARRLDVDEHQCLAYLRDHLRFRLGRKERQGLEKFRQLAVRHELIPDGVHLVFNNPEAA